MGQVSSEAVKEFVETGDTETLDSDKALSSSATDGNVLDGFTAPPIEQGSGISHAKLFIDGNHTMVWTKKS